MCERLKKVWSKNAPDTPESVYLRLISFKKQMQLLQSKIVYSTKYADEEYEYRHAFLPPELSRMVPSGHLLTESEWRNLGVQQSIGWEHYMIHNPEPHILLFRRSVRRWR